MDSNKLTLTKDQIEAINKAPNKEFKMRNLTKEDEKKNKFNFTLTNYNLLIQDYASNRLFPYIDKDNQIIFDRDYRKDLIIDEIAKLDSDIFCLEEITLDSYQFIKESMPSNYESEFIKRQENVNLNQAIFYNKNKFKLAESKIIDLNSYIRSLVGSDNSISKLFSKNKENKEFADLFNEFFTYKCDAQIHVYEILTDESNKSKEKHHLVLGCTHLTHNPIHDAIKVNQICFLLENLYQFYNKYNNKDNNSKAHIVLSGDLNAQPTNSVVNLITNRNISKDSLEKETMVMKSWLEYRLKNIELYLTVRDYYSEMTKKLGVNNVVEFTSLYDDYYNKDTQKDLYEKSEYGNPLYTNSKKAFQNTLDHIFFTQGIKAEKLLEVDYKVYEDKTLGAEGFLPNLKHASDHVPIKGEFSIAL